MKMKYFGLTKGYLDSISSLAFKTSKTKLYSHAVYSSRYLQSKLMFNLSHASMVKIQYSSKLVEIIILQSHEHSKLTKTHLYRLYSLMIGSEIIAGSQSKV